VTHPVDLSVANIQWQIAAEWLAIPIGRNGGVNRKPPSLFAVVRSMTPTTSPSLKMGVPNALLVICRISNGHMSTTGDPIHIMFGSRVGFSGSADRMALFPVRSNPEWQPTAILENYSGIMRFPAIAQLSC